MAESNLGWKFMGCAKPYMICASSVVQCGNGSPDDGVGQESRGILGDWAHILAHRQTAWLPCGQPRADRRVVSGISRQPSDRLAHESFLAIRAGILVDRLSADDDADVGAFARVERLAHK